MPHLLARAGKQCRGREIHLGVDRGRAQRPEPPATGSHACQAQLQFSQQVYANIDVERAGLLSGICGEKIGGCL